LIIEENAASAVDLQIYKTRGEEGASREARLRPIGGNVAPRAKFNDAPRPDQERGSRTPAMTIKNSIRQNRMAVGP
jgi:hypothetical protein